MIERLIKFKQFIDAAVAETGASKELIAALILTENEPCDPMARRKEPAFYDRYIKGQPTWIGSPWYDFPEIIAASYGLTQVMFTTAQQIARKHAIEWSGQPWDLFNPWVNIRLGAAHLMDCIAKYGSERDGVAAYNAGTPRKTDSGIYVNQAYVDRFEKFLGRRLSG
jgi:hypothetical protein